ncbi:MAG: hypothetical protein Q6K80_11420 [Thermostichus sp. DG_1_6_bins_120]
MARTSRKQAPNARQDVVQENGLLQTATQLVPGQLVPGMWVRVLYPPYARGALGMITARENTERWLVRIPGDPEGLLLSLAALELLPAMGMTAK